MQTRVKYPIRVYSFHRYHRFLTLSTFHRCHRLYRASGLYKKIEEFRPRRMTLANSRLVKMMAMASPRPQPTSLDWRGCPWQALGRAFVICLAADALCATATAFGILTSQCMLDLLEACLTSMQNMGALVVELAQREAPPLPLNLQLLVFCVAPRADHHLRHLPPPTIALRA